MKKKRNLILATALTLIMLAAGCGGAKMSLETSAGNSQNYSSGNGENGWSADTAEEKAVDTAAASASSEEASDSGGSAQIETPRPTENDLANRKLIKNISLSLDTEEFDQMKQNMEESITSFGGYIEYSSYDAPQGTYSRRYYSLTARIPAENLDEFVTAAGKLGTLTNKSENVEDVTLDYVDKSAYKESLQVEYDRVTELLEKAADLEQVLALESKLSQLRYEINSYESQLRTYDNLIAYSTVHIYISEVEHESAVSNTVGSRISNGFLNSLYSIRDFFVNLFVYLVSSLPVLLLLALAAVSVILLLKKYKKHHIPKKRKMIKDCQKDTSDSDPS